MDLPTGTVTFLFTDVEGSTRLVKALGDPLRRCSRHAQAAVAAGVPGNRWRRGGQRGGRILRRVSQRERRHAGSRRRAAWPCAPTLAGGRGRPRADGHPHGRGLGRGRGLPRSLGPPHRAHLRCRPWRPGRSCRVRRATWSRPTFRRTCTSATSDLCSCRTSIVPSSSSNSSSRDCPRRSRPWGRDQRRSFHMTSTSSSATPSWQPSRRSSPLPLGRQARCHRGPAGIGKTRLLAEARARAGRAGLQVLSARGSELELEFPFGAVRQLFEPLLAAAPPRSAAELLAGAAELATPIFDPASLCSSQMRSRRSRCSTASSG